MFCSEIKKYFSYFQKCSLLDMKNEKNISVIIFNLLTITIKD